MKKCNKKCTCKNKSITEMDNFNTPLTFNDLRKTNVARCESDIRKLNSWSSLEWGACVAGELGELLNYIKKVKRGDVISKQDIIHEFGDIVAYLDLCAASMDIDLGEAVREKFNIVSKRYNSKYKL